MRQCSSHFTRVESMYGKKIMKKSFQEFSNKWKHHCRRSGKGRSLGPEPPSLSFGRTYFRELTTLHAPPLKSFSLKTDS